MKDMYRNTYVPPKTLNPNLVIGTMSSAVVLIIASVAALSPVLSTIGEALKPSQTELQWVVDIFALSLAALLLPMGELGDRFGRKKIMLLGFGVFTSAAIWGIFANSIDVLILSRLIGGVGAAMIFPGTLATLTATMPEEKRGQAVAIWTASASLGGTIGMVISGTLVEFFWFGSLFVFLTLFAIVTAIATLLLVPETSLQTHGRFDFAGGMLSVLGVAAFVFAVIEGPVKGWTDPVTLISFGVSFSALLFFVFHESRTKNPMLNVRLFLQRRFNAGFLLVFIQFLVVFGYFFVAAQFLGFVKGYSPFLVAAALLPVGVLLPVLSLKAPIWSKRYGRGKVGATGLLLMAAATLIFGLSEPNSSYLLFAAALLIFGAGMGLSGPPGTEAIIESLPAEQQGVASAMNDLSRELGGAVGIAILGSAMTSGYRDQIAQTLNGVPAEVISAIKESAANGFYIASEGSFSAIGIAQHVNDALSEGFTNAMLLASIILAIGAILVALVTPKESRDDKSVEGK